MTTGPRYPTEEYARRGRQIYREQIKPTLREEDIGKFVSIDIETADFEMGPDELANIDRLFARRPDAQIWTERAGYTTAHAIGAALRRET